MDFSQLTFDQRLAYALALADTNTVLPTAYRHNAGAILFAMEMGEAAGLANISAVLNGIHLIPDSSGDVKPTISVNMMTAAVLKHGFTLEADLHERVGRTARPPRSPVGFQHVLDSAHTGNAHQPRCR